MDNKYLLHYGVLGMRWGVRRNTSSSSGSSRGLFRRKAKDTKGDGKIKTKKRTIQDLTNDELNTKIRRMELEKRYKDLAAQTNPPKSERGRKFVIDVLEQIGKNTLTNIGTQVANKGLGLAINKALGVKSYTKDQWVNPNKGQADKK